MVSERLRNAPTRNGALNSPAQWPAYHSSAFRSLQELGRNIGKFVGDALHVSCRCRVDRHPRLLHLDQEGRIRHDGIECLTQHVDAISWRPRRRRVRIAEAGK
jgi:hypothetical protein